MAAKKIVRYKGYVIKAESDRGYTITKNGVWKDWKPTVTDCKKSIDRAAVSRLSL